MAVILLGALGLNVISQFYKKVILGTSRIPLASFVVESSIILALLSLGAVPLWSFDLGRALEPSAVLLFLAVLCISVVFPWLFYGAMRKETLGRFEIMVSLQPILTIAFAGLILPEERDPSIWFAAALGFGALLWAHRSHSVIRFDRYERQLFFIMLLSAIEAVFVKQLLDIYAPFTFYTVRALLLMPLMVLVHWKVWRPAFGRHTRQIGLSSVLSFLSVPVVYMSYQLAGVSLTTLVLGLVAPLILYLLGERVLHEQGRLRYALAGLVILGSIGYVFTR